MGERESRVRALFEQASGVDRKTRSKLIEQAGGSDPSVAGEVESLLKYHDQEAAILDGDALQMARVLAAPGEGAGGPPAQVGRYWIVGELGRGGMGVVYEARQESPRRSVALKLIRSDFITAGMMRRFGQEAEALGLLQHPAIAQIYESGTHETAQGPQPFIAMELVRGETITRYAERAGLSVRERLALFAQVCDAIDHAHRRGVVHRDIKPGNILVETEETQKRRDEETKRGEEGDKARPKVLDFGVARLLEREGNGGTYATGAGQLLGTLSYMSPEQALGDPSRVDARADVYALGCVLYELLCGTPPHEVSKMALPEALSVVTTSEPARPSTRNPATRGEVETIVLRALEKDPAQRYQHASDLAADIRRHLADEPILARPWTTGYLARMLIRRIARSWTGARKGK